MAEFEIQRGVNAVQNATVNVTVTSATKAFGRATNSCFTKGGVSAGDTSSKTNAQLGCGVLLTTSTNLQLKGNTTGDAVDYDVAWEIWNYSGAASGPNEWIVRAHSSPLMNAGTAQVDVLLGSALTVNISDCIAFMTGNGASGASQNWSDANYTVELVTVTTSVYARVKRITSDTRQSPSIVGIEFTGSNWVVQNNISHTFTAAGSDETETITDVSDWTKAFIVGSHRSPTGNDGNDEITITIRPGSGTTSVRFRMRSGASSPGSVVAIAHVVKNLAIKVEHLDSITGSGTDLPAGSASPQTENVTITTVKATAQTALIGYTDCDDTATNYPRAHWNYRLTSTSNVEFWRGRHGAAGDWALQVIQFEYDQTISAAGNIATEEAIGTATVLRGNVNVLPSAIDTAETFGTVTVARGAVTVTPNAIASDESFGSATVLRGAVTVLPSSIASDEAIGSVTVLRGAVSISPTGIDGAEAFGTAVIVPGVVIVSPSAISSGEGFGSPIVSQGASFVLPDAISSAEAFGTTVVLRGAVIVAPGGIASAEAVGSHVVLPGGVIVNFSGRAIPSAEAFGTVLVNRYILGQAIDTAEAFGPIIVQPGPRIVLPTAIASDEAFGTPLIGQLLQAIYPAGIGSAESFGSLWLFRHSDPAFKTLLALKRDFAYTPLDRSRAFLPQRKFVFEGL